ncbi:phylloplanin-like [Nicotiana tabacum]|uniref:Phylloplanin-like n=1 Tax=Nicotiana tabacum TaxID=4097 RepID=A0A1S4BKP1_TOBAC|nr:phylloplanin-like [Nicotiana tomentosiformis]XP_016489420.1 PREDICTED: phylloplanin-like [Nicotiana tabacum]
MALAKIFLISFLVALIATPVAVAQLGGLLSGLLGPIHIDGVLFCSLNGQIDIINGSTTPVFPNASVQLRCGAGNVVSSTTTNGSGVFSLVLDPLQNILSSLLSNCSLVVTTPLSTCNASLPSIGLLQSPLQLVGKTLVGLLSIVNLGATGFQLLPNLI